MIPTNQISVGARRRISPQDIILFNSDINYTQVYLTNGSKLVVATTLKILEKRFSETNAFFRTHKSFLVNLSYVKTYQDSKPHSFIEMKNGYRVEVSRRKKKILNQLISTANH